MRSPWWAIWDGVRLRCPRCGRGRIYRSRWEMHAHCPVCRLGFEQGEGDFVGAMTVAYAITAVLIATGVFILMRTTNLSAMAQVAIWSAFGTLFLVLFYRNMKGIWIGILYLITGAHGR